MDLAEFLEKTKHMPEETILRMSCYTREHTETMNPSDGTPLDYSPFEGTLTCMFGSKFDLTLGEVRESAQAPKTAHWLELDVEDGFVYRKMSGFIIRDSVLLLFV